MFFMRAVPAIIVKRGWRPASASNFGKFFLTVLVALLAPVPRGDRSIATAGGSKQRSQPGCRGISRRRC